MIHICYLSTYSKQVSINQKYFGPVDRGGLEFQLRIPPFVFSMWTYTRLLLDTKILKEFSETLILIAYPCQTSAVQSWPNRTHRSRVWSELPKKMWSTTNPNFCRSLWDERESFRAIGDIRFQTKLLWFEPNFFKNPLKSLLNSTYQAPLHTFCSCNTRRGHHQM